MHREGTDRNITPTTKQQLNSGSGTIPGSEAPTPDLDTETAVTPVHNQATMAVDPTGPSLRWTTFEDTLRRRPEDVLRSSIETVKRASGEKPFERRKAG